MKLILISCLVLLCGCPRTSTSTPSLPVDAGPDTTVDVSTSVDAQTQQ